MAFGDSADLLARCKRLAQLSSTDTSMADTDWYAYLTEAQAHVYNVWAAHVPWVLMGAPTAMSTADSGATYTFSSSITPLAVEIYDANYNLLKNGAFWDTQAGYVWEGIRIRFPKAVSKIATYYARYITPPGVIAAATEPTLVPTHGRMVLVYHALWLWATMGNLRDPQPFANLEQAFLWGDPARGSVGVLIALKTQNPFAGSAAYQTSSGMLNDVSTGAGYVGMRY